MDDLLMTVQVIVGVIIAIPVIFILLMLFFPRRKKRKALSKGSRAKVLSYAGKVGIIVRADDIISWCGGANPAYWNERAKWFGSQEPRYRVRFSDGTEVDVSSKDISVPDDWGKHPEDWEWRLRGLQLD